MWQKPPSQPFLNHNEIHIWLGKIDEFKEDIYYLNRTLSDDEVARRDKYKIEKIKNNFIINRGLLRLILAKYLAIAPENILFEYSDKGKPFLANKHQRKIHFNLSHKGNYTVFAFAQINLGIDLEKISNKVKAEDIAHRFFTKDEYQDICQLEPDQRSRYFLELWTAKEAYLKAIGTGLSGGLNSINLRKNQHDNQWQILSNNSHQWQIKNMEIEEDILISLAVKSESEFNYKYYFIDSIK